MSFSSLFPFGNGNGQNKDDRISTRPMAVAGSFYPANKDSIVRLLSEYFQPFKHQKKMENIAAVIVPHAGYVFSGAVAASAYSLLEPDRQYEHIFLIGPSHHIYMDGASVNDQFEYYETPMGKVKVDTALCRKLIHDSPFFSCNPDAHREEHCLEVQLPFLQFRLKKVPPIIPIIIATQSLPVIQQIAEVLKPYFNDKNLFIISSDFSHYPSYKDAEKVDRRTGKAIAEGSPYKFIEIIAQNEKDNIPNLVTSACGESAILTLLFISSKMKDIQIHPIMYRNSGDSEYGDHLRVVGYHTFVLTRSGETNTDTTFSLTKMEKEILLQIARRTIQNKLNHSSLPVYDEKGLTDALKMPCGAFVTINEGGKLRGCIGHFGSDQPLYSVVAEMAEAAAFEDPRFYPLQPGELTKIGIEISVLSPMKRIYSIDEFTLGKQGIYMSKGTQSGTFLPQVAEETNWSKEVFLEHCAHDKAGLSWDGWKDADLYTYEAVVFNEEK